MNSTTCMYPPTGSFQVEGWVGVVGPRVNWSSLSNELFSENPPPRRPQGPLQPSRRSATAAAAVEDVQISGIRAFFLSGTEVKRLEERRPGPELPARNGGGRERRAGSGGRVEGLEGAQRGRRTVGSQNPSRSTWVHTNQNETRMVWWWWLVQYGKWDPLYNTKWLFEESIVWFEKAGKDGVLSPRCG